MHQNIVGKNVRITQNVRSYIAEKMKNIKVYSKNIIEANIICEFLHLDYFVEITLSFGKKIFHTKEKDKDLYIAIDSVFHKIEREVKNMKDKVIDKHCRNIKQEDNGTNYHCYYNVETLSIYDKPLFPYDALFSFDKSKKHYFAYLPLKQSEDMYSVKVGKYPNFLFKNDNKYIEISLDDNINFSKSTSLHDASSWTIKELVLGINNVDEKFSEKYEIKEYNVGEAINELLSDSSKKLIVYINSVTSKPEALYEESETDFALIRLFNI